MPKIEVSGDLPTVIENEEGLYDGDLIFYFRVLFFRAGNLTNPYHNFRHMTHVTWLCYQACRYYRNDLSLRQKPGDRDRDVYPIRIVLSCVRVARMIEVVKQGRNQQATIWTVSGSAVRAAKAATTSIPIVMWAPDPVRIDLVATLARPGGNVTGFAMPHIELIGKRIEIAREAIPSIGRIAVFGASGNNPTAVALQDEFARLSAALGLELQYNPSAQPDFEAALAWVKSVDVDAIYIATNRFLIANRERLVAVATERRLPLICDGEEWAKAGALISYSEDTTDIWDRSAGYIDRILRGANPADLPVQQPTKFTLVINVKTARVLGLTVPQLVLDRADKVIE